MKRSKHSYNHRHSHSRTKTAVTVAASILLIFIGFVALWISTLQIPDVGSFTSRKVSTSTKIYDRTGNVLLFDTGANARRTVIGLADMSPYVLKATIAIEDSNFYNNSGIEPLSIIRAILADLSSGGYEQGASTITQQVVKNSLLTTDKTITRKVKEWVLAVKLTRVMSKDDILRTYLNEISYGGTIYGIEAASQQFFGHPAKDITLAEAIYLAAIPQAPTYFSPYGTHKEALKSRAETVLKRMHELGMVTDDEYKAAAAEKVTFLSKNSGGIKAPHFVMYVRDYLVSKYGEDMVSTGGLKVITTLDYEMQKKAEEVITNFSPSLAKNYNASNTAMIAIDPKTGDILTMVGSKDYFDNTIDGNYNVTMAKRQPGSTLKPFVYATSFKKGLTPETILWDIKTEFSTLCNPDGKPKNPTDDPEKVCYSPGEYDDTFEGPISIRKALAQSRNIPAVQALYIAGISDTVQTAEDMGLTISSPDRCGLTLVLGGCEVSLLDLAGGYGVFANDGVRNPQRTVLAVYDQSGNIIEQASQNPVQVIPAEIARQVSSILSDTNVRMDSLKPIGESVGRVVAIKTGTTNDYRDVWTLGYTPNLVVGAWAGNNDNVPMQHNVAGLIISPLWGAFMSKVAKNFPAESFVPPPQPLTEGKPVLRGIWQGGITYQKDKISGKVATEYTPQQTKEDVIFNDVHSILYWVDKDNISGPAPMAAANDSQFPYWEYAVGEWLKTYKTAHPDFQNPMSVVIPTEKDDVHIPQNLPSISIKLPTPGMLIDPKQSLQVELLNTGRYPVQKTEVYMNGKYITTAYNNPLNFSFVPNDVGNVERNNVLSITLYDTIFNKVQATTTFTTNIIGTTTSNSN
ncbi:MAG: transglycosylase domain-containing protein [Candidatus Taylorbacteria bacterium]|nr:transglycosylase domain-containing protein [Candidatus Taylorbacteria bacterium]